MKKNITLLLTGLAAFSFSDLAQGVEDEEEFSREKCYCIAKAGQNNCAPNSSHTCAGLSTKDFDCNDWKYVAAGSCEEIGGSLIAGKKPLK